ncbi:YfhE family protein [Falsibacillus pallidus]
MEKRKGEKERSTLTCAQEITYNKSFKAADRVAGYNTKRNK